ncbi:MAG TPA: SDR family oxidoreductase [Bryobacteraceae bacterium]|jgi:dTDP-4-dehydrorhamnose reductase|nr:SDR family oxidoreductase [Bryobacteraceae bacterium]
MRVLVFGATGILGHQLMRRLGRRFEVYGTVRRESDLAQAAASWSAAGILGGVAVEDPGSVSRAIRIVRPHAAVNCIASPPWLQTRGDLNACIAVNAKFPHDLAGLCENAGARLIHISTDGVFSGSRGQYTECDPCDATDPYGKAKFLGEVSGPNCLTLRTSFIGRDLRRPGSGLLEWLLSQRGRAVKGYRRSFFTGLTSGALSDVIQGVLSGHPTLAGLFHVAGPRISKLALLEALRDRFKLSIRIEPDDSTVCDRSLDGFAFERRTGIRPPSWPAMLEELYPEPPLPRIEAAACKA